MSELEIYIQEQSENDKSLKELQIQRTIEEKITNNQNDSSKVLSFLQKMNLKNFEQNYSFQTSQNQNNQILNQQLMSFSPKRQDLKTSESPKKKVSVDVLLNQENQTSFCQPSVLIEDINEYEKCKNILKKQKNERNDKDQNILQNTLGNNLEIFQKYKNFLPSKSFKELLNQFEYQQCSSYEQILNIESKSNSIYFLMKGELGMFIPRIENKISQQDLLNTNNKETQQNDLSPIKNNQIKQALSYSRQFQYGQNQFISEKQMEESGVFHRQKSQEYINNKKSISQSYNTFNSQETEKHVIYDVNQVRNKFKQEMEERFKNFKLIKFASAGDMFGETSLEYRNQEIFSIVCATNCEFAILQQSAFNNLLAHKFFLTHLEINKMFKKTQLFYNWPHYSLYEFSKIAQRHILGMNEVIFNIGDKIDRIYFMCSGLIYKIHPSSSTYESQQQFAKIDFDSNIKLFLSLIKRKKNIIRGYEQVNLGTNIELINHATVFGEEGIVNGNDDIQQIQSRQYQVISKREDTILYSIEMNIFKNLYFYIIAKEGLDNYEQQEEKKKRKFLDSIYRSIRQIERVQLLEKTFDDFNKQKVKEEKRKQFQNQQRFNDTQIINLHESKDKENRIQSKNIKQLSQEREQDENIKMNNQSQKILKKRSHSQLSYKQSLKQGMVVFNSINFTESQLNKLKQIQIKQSDKTLVEEDYQKKDNTQKDQNCVNENTNEQQNNDKEQKREINNNIQKQQQNGISLNQKTSNQIQKPFKQFELIKYDVYMQLANKQNLNNSQIKQNQNPQTQLKEQKPSRLRISNSSQYNVKINSSQDDNQNKQEEKQSSFKVTQNISEYQQDQENVQKNQKKDIDQNDDTHLNELIKFENNYNMVENKTSRQFKINYNNYKNIIQNVNKVQKNNHFYDRNNYSSDLFKNTSMFFNKKENDINQSENLPFSSASKVKSQSSDKRVSSLSSNSQKNFVLKKTPFQKYKDSTDETKKVIKMRRSLSERKHHFQMKIKQLEPNNSQNQLQTNESINEQYSYSIIGEVLNQLINTSNCYDFSLSNTNKQNTNNSNQQFVQQNTLKQYEPSNDKLQINSKSYLQNNIIEYLKQQQDQFGNPLLSKEEMSQIKMINFQMPDSTDLNTQSSNRVYNNIFKLRQKQNSSSKSHPKQIQSLLNKTDVKLDKSNPPTEIKDKMRSLQTHLQNFEFFAKCNKDQQKSNDIHNQNQILSEDFLSRPFTAATVQNIFSKKTQIKELVNPKQLKVVMSTQSLNKNKQN